MGGGGTADIYLISCKTSEVQTIKLQVFWMFAKNNYY
jgi:hypothetical protein